MADFGVLAVRYNSDRSHIDYLHVAEDYPNGFGTKRVVPRAFVADLIRMNKATFKTWVVNSENKWAPGADVHVLEDVYLSTDRNSRTRDNLGSLPEF